MKPVKVAFYIYAESSEEVEKLQKVLHSFVMGLYNDGSLVTASKLAEAVKKLEGNSYLKRYFK